MEKKEDEQNTMTSQNTQQDGFDFRTDNEPKSFFKTALDYDNVDNVSRPQIHIESGPPHSAIEDERSAMKSKMASRLRKGSPALSRTYVNENKDAEAELKPEVNTFLQVLSRVKSPVPLGSQAGSGSVLQLLKLRNIARNVKNIQQDRQKRLENTGNVTIYDKFRKFDSKIAEQHMTQIIQQTLHHVTYEPDLCKSLSLLLSDEIRNTMKSLKFPRYKFVAFVTIGQKGCQRLIIASRCVWSTDNDSYACVKFENKTLFANAVVFALLHK